jgi:hypothetical protein
VLDSTTDVLDTLVLGEIPSSRLPLDLHVVEKDMLLQSFAEVVPQLLQSETPGYIPIAPRSLHVNWEKTPVPYNFLKDFLFSFTPSSWKDEELRIALAETRRNAKPLIKEDIVDRVIAITPKEGRMLNTQGIRQNLEDRVADW